MCESIRQYSYTVYNYTTTAAKTSDSTDNPKQSSITRTPTVCKKSTHKNP